MLRFLKNIAILNSIALFITAIYAIYKHTSTIPELANIGVCIGIIIFILGLVIHKSANYGEHHHIGNNTSTQSQPRPFWQGAMLMSGGATWFILVIVLAFLFNTKA
jgi:uncharacterized membrane protein